MNSLVTCICPTTASRRKFLPRAIDCFLKQTYTPRELLIVTEPGEAIEVPDHPLIRVVRTPGLLRLGAKRNFACEQAYGEIIAHFDDDDVSAAERLADQVSWLVLSGLGVTGYSQMKFTDGNRWWKYTGDPKFPLGTSLCYWKSWWEQCRFPDQQESSDTVFTYAAQGAGQVSVHPWQHDVRDRAS